MNIKVFIMAAGASRRLGQPKQLLDFGESNLISYCIDQCLKSDIGPVTVVLGAHASLIRKSISTKKSNILVSPEWAKGLGYNIAYAVKNTDLTDVDGVVIILADQPYLQAKQLINLVQKVNPSTNICLSKYNEGSGPPVYFSKRLFKDLGQLTGDEGAKEIILANQNAIEHVVFPNGYLDIDTKEDLKTLRNIILENKVPSRK